MATGLIPSQLAGAMSVPLESFPKKPKKVSPDCRSRLNEFTHEGSIGLPKRSGARRTNLTAE